MQAVYLNPLTFAIAQLSQFNPEERKAYEDSIKHYRDLKNSFDTAHQEGLAEGIELGRQEGLEEGIELGVQKGRQQALAQIVHNLHSNGLTTAVIAQMTGMSVDDVERLLLS